MSWTANLYVFIALSGIARLMFVPFMVYVSSLVALITPCSMRGRVNAGFLAIFTIIGLGRGPVCVGFLTEHAFGEAQLGIALLTMSMTGSLTALICVGALLRTW